MVYDFPDYHDKIVQLEEKDVQEVDEDYVRSLVGKKVKIKTDVITVDNNGNLKMEIVELNFTIAGYSITTLFTSDGKAHRFFTLHSADGQTQRLTKHIELEILG